MTPLGWAAFVAAGSLGACLRHLVDVVVHPRLDPGRIPWGTVAVNVAGSFVLGVLTGLDLDRSTLLVLGGGFCGSSTTFSTFSYQTARLAEDGAIAAAIRNVAVTLVLGLTAAGCGYALAA